MDCRFIKEVCFPKWLANVVMVRKSSMKWRMCEDYTDLNKVCPKDPYTLPGLNRTMNGIAGQELLSFMDAFLGYNQIKMY